MEKQVDVMERRCPKCGHTDRQVNAGYNRSGTRRCVCNYCKHKYTLNGKTRAYPEEVRQQAIRLYDSGVSGRGVGKALGIGKENAERWIKKRINVEK